MNSVETETDLARCDATQQAELIRSGEISAGECVAAAVNRARQVNGTLNAIVHERYDAAIDEAKRVSVDSSAPFAGVPFVIKDLTTPQAGELQCEGNIRLKELGHRATRDANVVVKAREAGLISLGRTNTPEFAAGRCAASAETLAFGDTANPWNPLHTAMGSSGGSAAAVASGIVPVAHATDGGGSVRIPASACGIVGLKPSRGRISMGPDMGEAWNGGTTHGIHSRTVRDCALLLDLWSGYFPGDHYTAPAPTVAYSEVIATKTPNFQIGVLPDSPYGGFHPECRNALEETTVLLEELGHTVKFVPLEPYFNESALEAFTLIMQVEVHAKINRFREFLGRDWREDDMESVTWLHYIQGQQALASQYYEAKRILNDYTRTLCRWWQDAGIDLLMAPTLGDLVPQLGYLVEEMPFEEKAYRILHAMPCTIQFNFSGQPAISLPLHESESDLPIGIQFGAQYLAEDKLLSLAAQLEQALPWDGRVPRIHAVMD